MRYAFIKFGNVIEELQDIGPMPLNVPKSGPKTFSSNYLKLAGSNPTLMISCGAYKNNDVYNYKNVEARLYNQFSGILRLFSVLVLFIKISYRLIKFHPTFTVCVQDGPALWSTYIVNKFTNMPFIHSRQRAISIFGDSWRRQISVKIDNYVIRRATCVICHGPFTKSQLVSIGVPKERIIEYDVQFDDLFTEIAHSKKSYASKEESKHKKILFLGRVSKLKGVFDLLEACEPIFHSKSNVQLIYVGDGQDLSTLKKQISQKDLTDRVIITGAVPHEKIFNYLCDATLMAMPTQHGLEGWGMSAVEALAMGVPVVAPNAGPFKYMINDGLNGLLYDVDSILDLRRKMELILNDSNLRNKLSKEAVRSETRRNKKLITFGQALKLAHDRVIS